MRLFSILALSTLSAVTALGADEPVKDHPCKKEIAKFCSELKGPEDPRVKHCLMKARKDSFNAKEFTDDCKKYLDANPVRVMRKRWMKDMEEAMTPPKQ